MTQFTVEDHGRFAIITQTVDFGNALHPTVRDPQLEFVTIINKATNTEASEEEFEAYLEELQAAQDKLQELLEGDGEDTKETLE